MWHSGPARRMVENVRFVKDGECDFARVASHSEGRFCTKTNDKVITSNLIAKNG